jgi:hypothetical protein
MCDLGIYWDCFDKLATIIGVISVIIAARSSWKLRDETERRWQKETELVRVILRSQSREITLPVEIKRGDFTRSELLGYIGMLPLVEGKTRFNLAFTCTSDFSSQLDNIRRSGTEFVLGCSEGELDQFNYDKQAIALPYPTS